MFSLYVGEDSQQGEGEGGEGQGLKDDKGKTETQQQALEDVGPVEPPTAASAVGAQLSSRQQVRLRVSTKCGERFQSEEGGVK